MRAAFSLVFITFILIRESIISSAIFSLYYRRRNIDIYNRKLKKDDDKDDAKDSKKEAVKTASLNYDESPKFHKRSTAELIARVCFLLDLLDYSKSTPQGDFKDPADKNGAKEELAQIRKALVDRGFDKEELSMLGLGN